MTQAPESRSDDRRSRLNSTLAWVGIVAGVVFVVAVIFFSGFYLGRVSDGGFGRGYDHHGMMWPGGMMGPGQMGPGQMGPGQMGPGQMGPGQSPTTTATPRP